MAKPVPPRPPAPGPWLPDGGPRLFTARFVLTCLAAMAFFISHHSVLVAVPLYALHRGGSERDAGVLTLLFTLAALVGRLPVGWAMDRWSRRPIMMAGAGIGLLSALLYPGIERMPELFALRLFHGLAMALFSTAAAAVVTDVVPPARRGEGMGYFGMGSNVSLALAPVLSLAIVTRYSFPPLFLASAGMAFTSLALGAAVRESAPPVPARLSFQLESFFTRSAVFPAAVMGALTVGHGALVTFLPLMGKARAVGNVGTFFTVAAVVLVGVRAKAGSLSDRWGRGPIIVPGMFLVGLAMWAVGFSHGPRILATAGALYGLGFGLAQPALMALVGDRAAPAERGRAIATYYSGWELGIGVGAYALGHVLARTDFTAVYGTAGLIVAGGALLYVLGAARRARRPRPQAP